MEERKSIDDALVNASYYDVKKALYIMEVLNRTGKNLCLDKEITPEFKRKLKDDMGFTQGAISCLTKAAKDYQGYIKALEQLEGELDKKVKAGEFDGGTACMFDLLRLELTYMCLSYAHPENEKKVHDFLKTLPGWDEDLKKVYASLTHRIKRLQ